MASLTHVCIWKDKGWKRITAYEAAKIHPGGTVSAHSGLFMCELCGQYVLLTDGAMRVRHFRHSSSEKSKDCPERKSGAGVRMSYAQGEHDLPIKLVNVTRNNFDLEIGLVRVPSNYMTPKLRVEIKSQSNTIKPFVYLRERINTEGITYLSIGNTPSEQYQIRVTGASDNIYQFWPKSTLGIDPSGTIFDASTGKKLIYDSDVVVKKKYYLLKRSFYIIYHNPHVSIREICCKIISGETWRIYEVVANDYDEQSARFFLDYHCRLTEVPVSIQTVWPVYVESPYIIKYNHKSVILSVTGNAPTTQVFPSAVMRKFAGVKGAVLEINCNNRQQLISAGRTKALTYTYFWKESLDKTTEQQYPVITDLHYNSVEAGIHHKILEDKALRICVPYDGLCIIKMNDVVIEKRKLRANNFSEIDNICWNMTISIYVGFDCVWRASFIRKEIIDVSDEKEIFKKLRLIKGTKTSIDHTAGSMADSLKEYPQIRQWLRQRILEGTISVRAYKELQILANKGRKKK